MTDEDVRLMLALKDGDHDAFAALVESHQQALIGYFYAQGSDLQLAEDCAQETWRRVFRARKDYVPKARFRTFLFRIARNLWIDQVRARRHRPPPISLDQPRGAPQDRDTTLSAIQTNGADEPPSMAERHELAERVHKAIQRLNEGQREVFVLAEFEGMKYEEIGEVLGIPVGTVKSRMFNAIRRLREMLQREMS